MASSKDTAISLSTAMFTTTAVPKVIHLNHAGASPSSHRVTACMVNHSTKEQALGGYQAAAEVRQSLHSVYDKAAKLIGADSGSEIAMVESATVGWTRLFYSFCVAKNCNNDCPLDEHRKQSKRKVILVSEAEYAANVVAACQWARSNQPCEGFEGWNVLTIPSRLESNDGKSTGKVDVEKFREMLEGTFYCHDGSLLDPLTIEIVCVTHIPTNSGIVNPAEEIGNMITNFNIRHQHEERKAGSNQKLPRILYLLDSCQSIGQREVDVRKIQCHGLVATGRKYLRGPRGTGFLYIPDSISNAIVPHHVDHFGMPVQHVPTPVEQVLAPGIPIQDLLSLTPLPNAKRFEFWESNIGNRLALGEALQECLDHGIHSIQQCIQERVDYLYSCLQDIPDVNLYYKPECGICTFSLILPKEEKQQSVSNSEAVVDPVWVKNELWGNGSRGENNSNEYQFDISIVPATSTPLDSARTGVPNLIRASVSYTNTNDEIRLFCQQIRSIVESLKRKSPNTGSNEK